jgi:dUTP pyrophosphatase
MISIIKVNFAIIDGIGGRAPTVATDGSVGHDLYATTGCQIQPGRTAVIDTGVAFAIPPGVMGQVLGRSGMATRGILTHTGTIDQDYRGPVRVILANIGPDAYTIEAGNRIAQLVLSPVLARPPTGEFVMDPPGWANGVFGLILSGIRLGGYLCGYNTGCITPGFAQLVQVDQDELGATARGVGGLGSSGL